MQGQIRYALMVALVALASTPAMAQDKGFYVGLGIGKSEFKDACTGAGGLNCDDSDSATKFFGGYQFNRNFAVEAGLTDLGNATISATGIPGDVKFEASGFEVVAVGIMPLNPKWSLYGKAGFFSWDLDVKDSTGLVGNASESGTDMTFGLGVSYDFTKNFVVRLEYQVYNDIGDENTTGTSDAGVFGASALYRF